MKFSVVIVTANRPKELFNCLQSVFNQKHHYDFETIVIFNGDLAYLEKCSQQFPKVKNFFIHKTTPAMARNYALSKACGEYIFFLDDDCELPKNYFQKLNFNLSWDVLGGPDRTPQHSTRFQIVTGRALTSSLCMGPTRYRHSHQKKNIDHAGESSLILCNLWMKAELFQKEKYCFNPSLFRNEENYLIKELALAGKTILRDSSLYVYHHRKNTFESLGLSIFKSAFYRVQNFSSLPQKNELIYFLPIFWLFALFWAFFHPDGVIINFFFLYTALTFLQYIIKYRSISFLYVVLHFFILFMYSLGLLKGMITFMPLLYKSFKENKSLIRESKSK